MFAMVKLDNQQAVKMPSLKIALFITHQVLKIGFYFVVLLFSSISYFAFRNYKINIRYDFIIDFAKHRKRFSVCDLLALFKPIQFQPRFIQDRVNCRSFNQVSCGNRTTITGFKVVRILNSAR